jgi:hypothetical protein
MTTSKAVWAGLIVLLLSALAAVAASGSEEHALQVGKKGEITLTQPTKVGDRVLQPDTYVVQHRVSGDQHFVRLVELKKISNAGRFAFTEKNKAGEIPCAIEPASEVARETTVYTLNEEGGPRITKIAVKGENVVHVFQAEGMEHMGHKHDMNGM